MVSELLSAAWITILTWIERTKKQHLNFHLPSSPIFSSYDGELIWRKLTSKLVCIIVLVFAIILVGIGAIRIATEFCYRRAQRKKESRTLEIEAQWEWNEDERSWFQVLRKKRKMG